MNNTVERTGDWIETLSGIKFYILDPRPEDFILSDMAHVISRELRFGCHTEKPYTVGQHTLMGVLYLKDRGHSAFIQFLFAIHDLIEAYMRDLPRPLKRIFPQYKDVEDRLMDMLMFEVFRIRKPTDEELRIVKHTDDLLCKVEAIELGVNKNGWAIQDDEVLHAQYYFDDAPTPPPELVKEELENEIKTLLQLIQEEPSHA